MSPNRFEIVLKSPNLFVWSKRGQARQDKR